MPQSKSPGDKREHAPQRDEGHGEKAAVRQLNLALLLLKKRRSGGMTRDEILMEMADYYFKDVAEQEIYASNIIATKAMGDKLSESDEKLKGAKRRMFLRDRQQIEDLGISIWESQKIYEDDETKYKIEPEGFSLPGTEFDSILGDQLIFALRSMNDLGGPLFSDNLFSVRLKLGLAGAEEASPDLYIELEGGGELSEEVVKLVGEKAVIEFSYKGLRSTDYKDHRVQTVGLIYSRGDWHLVAYDLKAEEYRLFRLSRMRGSGGEIKRARGAKTRPLEDEMEAIKRFLDEKPWEMGNDEVTVSIKISTEEAKRVIKELGSSVISSKAGEDGNVLAEARVKNLNLFCDWFIRMGTGAELLSPPEARTRILEKAVEIAKALSEGK